MVFKAVVLQHCFHQQQQQHQEEVRSIPDVTEVHLHQRRSVHSPCCRHLSALLTPSALIHSSPAVSVAQQQSTSTTKTHPTSSKHPFMQVKIIKHTSPERCVESRLLKTILNVNVFCFFLRKRCNNEGQLYLNTA